MDNTDLVFESIEAHFDEFSKALSSLEKDKKAREEYGFKFFLQTLRWTKG